MAAPTRFPRLRLWGIRNVLNCVHSTCSQLLMVKQYQICRGAKQKTTKWWFVYFGSPNQIRTGVLALKGRCPRPLDDGAKTAIVWNLFNPKCWQIITGIFIFVKANVFNANLFFTVWLLVLIQQFQLFLRQRLLRLVWFQPVGIQFLCRPRFSMSNDRRSGCMYQQLP